MYLLWFQWKMALYIIAYWNQGLILYVFFYEGYTESLQLNLMMKSQCQPCCASITFKVSKNRYVSRLLFVGFLIYQSICMLLGPTFHYMMHIWIIK